MPRTLNATTPGESRGRRRDARWRRRSLAPASLMAAGPAGVKKRLPATAQVRAGGAGLGRRLAAVLALVQPPHDQRQGQDQQRDRGDDDEAGVGDDLVVRLAVPALATVVREGRRGGREQGEEREGGGADGATGHRAG